MRVVIAFRAFFLALFSREASLRIAHAMELKPKTAATVSESTSPASKVPSSASLPFPKPSNVTIKRSEALTLLSTLQREARLVDLIQESLEGYSDEQIGAAARDVLRESSKVLDRLFAIKRLAEGSEGEQIEIPPNAPASKWKISGKSSSDPKASRLGNLIHAGWIATHVAVPQWSGNDDEATIIAPAEATLV